MKKQIDIIDWNKIDLQTKNKLIVSGKFNIIPDATILPNIVDMIDFLGDDWTNIVMWIREGKPKRTIDDNIRNIYWLTNGQLCDSLWEATIDKINETD